MLQSIFIIQISIFLINSPNLINCERTKRIAQIQRNSHLINSTTNSYSDYDRSKNNNNNNNCPFNPEIEIKNGRAEIIEYLGLYEISVICDDNYTLNINTKNILINCIDGKWKYNFLQQQVPMCEKRCAPPPIIEHGRVKLEKTNDDADKSLESYTKGTIAKYFCDDEYILEPASSYLRICENGKWSGSVAFCVSGEELRCSTPPIIDNGFIHLNTNSAFDLYNIGSKITYQCFHGFQMIGTDSIKCTDAKTWFPDPPACIKETDLFPTDECSSPILNDQLVAKIEISSVSNNVVEVKCKENYQNILAPCNSLKIYCKEGQWIGIYPHCVKKNVCSAPPEIRYAVIKNNNFASYDSSMLYYKINRKIEYECVQDFIMQGSSTILCKSGGCWTPLNEDAGWPNCVRYTEDCFVALNNLNPIMISIATGTGVLGILVLACLIVTLKKRRSSSSSLTHHRSVTISSSNNNCGTFQQHHHAPDLVNDHTILLQHPDRLALIAYADGVQNSHQNNNSLPSYDEATRDRSTVIQVSRLQIQRPYWPNLTVCRTSTRNRAPSSSINDATHLMHMVRHGSFASHTPSTRSGGESMGSMETVTISEGSTNITLDTASIHSMASQNPSCRGHCGSLASFDASSLVNTEGIPLLEENELEESQTGAENAENPCSIQNAADTGN